MQTIGKYFLCLIFFATIFAENAFGQNSNKNISFNFEETSIGSEVNFGTWNFEKDGTEKPIVWVVAEKNTNDKTLLLVSKYVIKNMQFGEDNQKSVWEDSKVRGWLNGTFYKNAFTQEEKEHIMTESVSAGDNPKYDNDKSAAVTDFVYILSIDEYEKFSKRMKELFGIKGILAKPVPYIKPYIKTYFGYPSYWLRTSGRNIKNVSSVNPTGRINYSGYSPAVYGGVRPVLRYSLDQVLEKAPVYNIYTETIEKNYVSDTSLIQDYKIWFGKIKKLWRYVMYGDWLEPLLTKIIAIIIIILSFVVGVCLLYLGVRVAICSNRGIDAVWKLIALAVTVHTLIMYFLGHI